MYSPVQDVQYYPNTVTYLRKTISNIQKLVKKKIFYRCINKTLFIPLCFPPYNCTSAAGKFAPRDYTQSATNLQSKRIKRKLNSPTSFIDSEESIKKNSLKSVVSMGETMRKNSFVHSHSLFPLVRVKNLQSKFCTALFRNIIGNRVKICWQISWIQKKNYFASCRMRNIKTKGSR